MKNGAVKHRIIVMAIAAALMLPAALAQDPQQDPHSHDWYNEQVKNKIDPATGQPMPQTTTATATGDGQPVSQSQQAANDTLKKSLGSIDENYRGQHPYYKDDILGNFFHSVSKGDPTSISILVLLAAIGGGLWFKYGRKKAAPATEEKARS